MLTVNAPVFAIFSVVLCSDMLMEISFISVIAPQAAFIASGTPFSSYVPTINTGIGYKIGFAPKSTLLIFVPPVLFIFCYSYFLIYYFRLSFLILILYSSFVCIRLSIFWCFDFSYKLCCLCCGIPGILR